MSAGRSVGRSVEEMTAAGVFGPGTRLESFELEGRHNELNQYASTVLYGTATTVGQDGVTRHHHRLVFKMKHREPEMRRKFKTDLQFGNEILFYERIMPFLVAGAPAAHRPPFCRYFYGRNDCGHLALRDTIVLENETSARGYRSAPADRAPFLDYDHAVVALRTLAKFHALSYRAKCTDESKFTETISGVAETQWCAADEWFVPRDGVRKLLDVALDRLAERRDAGHDRRCCDQLRCDRFRAELLADPKRSMKRAMEPAEPLAVLCHGDFNRNNLMFRYDDRGKPVDAIPFDMAIVRYGSPALDLSFFLYMNTDRQLRDARWDAMLDEYCAALTAAVSDATAAVPDRALVDAEIRERGFYALAHLSFFMRVTMEDRNPPDVLECSRISDDEVLSIVQRCGGDRATDAIADAVQHFIDIRYAADTAALATAGSTENM